LRRGVEASRLVEIAAELVISVKTASVHVSHILRKVDVPSRTDAARIAHRLD
jgi:DNA-binding NarL/FixJ family response regulator